MFRDNVVKMNNEVLFFKMVNMKSPLNKYDHF